MLMFFNFYDYILLYFLELNILKFNDNYNNFNRGIF